eukprot:722706-Prorocentrum_minimum.AAC.1
MMHTTQGRIILKKKKNTLPWRAVITYAALLLLAISILAWLDQLPNFPLLLSPGTSRLLVPHVSLNASDSQQGTYSQLDNYGEELADRTLYNPARFFSASLKDGATYALNLLNLSQTNILDGNLSHDVHE